MTQHSQPQRSASVPRHRLSPRVVTGVVLAALAAVFVMENRDLVGIRMLVPVVTMPLWTALGAMLVAGVVIGLLVMRPRK